MLVIAVVERQGAQRGQAIGSDPGLSEGVGKFLAAPQLAACLLFVSSEHQRDTEKQTGRRPPWTVGGQLVERC
jgi:hypothetical protein